MQEDIRVQLDIFNDRNVRMAAGIGFVVGLLIGWFLLGWWVFPVQWVNARPGDLHPEWQKHYLAMVIDSYLLTNNFETARARLEGFSHEQLNRLFRQVETDFEAAGSTRQMQAAQQLANQLQLAQATGLAPIATPAATTEAPAPAVGVIARPSTLGRRLAQVCGIVLIALLIVAGGVGAFLWYQGWHQGRAQPVEVQPAETRFSIGSLSLDESVTVQYQGQGPKFQQTYQIFHGERVIGECGLEAIPTLSTDDQVVACSVWLYEPHFPDQSADTCVLMSPGAYDNPAHREILSKDRDAGEVVLAQPGSKIYLHHATLELEIKVNDVIYSDPADRFLSVLSVTLHPTLWKQQPQETVGERDV